MAQAPAVTDVELQNGQMVRKLALTSEVQSSGSNTVTPTGNNPRKRVPTLGTTVKLPTVKWFALP